MIYKQWCNSDEVGKIAWDQGYDDAWAKVYGILNETSHFALNSL